MMSTTNNNIDPKIYKLFMAIRQALLMAVDAMEEYLSVNPRTAELRRIYKNTQEN